MSLILCAAAAVCIAAEPRVPAFPGAEGFGAYAKGGRGGRVLKVTNLEDYNSDTEAPIPGSFRAACEAEGPRTIVFEVSGWIDLKTHVNITNSYCTIAGQTAPGGGIGLRRDGLRIGQYKNADEQVHDVIVRYMRFRGGPGPRQGYDFDSLAINNAYDIMIDHCSVSWAVDECLSITAHPSLAKDRTPLILENRPVGKTYNVTVQWSIISEGLYNSTHAKGHHSRGLMCTYGSSRVSIHHNLMAHNDHRNPNLPWQLAGRDNPYIVDVVNNVVYNWHIEGAWTKNHKGQNPGFRQKGQINFVGNYYKMGPNSDKIHALDIRNKAWVWADGNIGPYRLNNEMDQFSCVTGNFQRAEARFNAPEVATQTAPEATKLVLAQSGATLPERDAVDKRVVREVETGTGGIIDDPSQRGGWPELKSGKPLADSDGDGMPDQWETEHGLDPAVADGAADSDNDGYTNLEEFLNGTDPQKPENII